MAGKQKNLIKYQDIQQLILTAKEQGKQFIEIFPEAGKGTVRLEYFFDEGIGIIDVVNPEVSDLATKKLSKAYNWAELKQFFNVVRKQLPGATQWQLNPDTAQKQRIYEGKFFKNDPNVTVRTDDLDMSAKGKPGFNLETGKPKYWAKGAVPDNVVQSAFEVFKENRARAKELSELLGIRVNAPAQFEYKNTLYGFHSKGTGRKSSLMLDGMGFKVVPSKDATIKEALRRATKLGLTPQMDPWEWKAIEDLYEYAVENGYHVDHIKPLDKGGLHFWENLQVLDAQDNLVKGAKENIAVTAKKTASKTIGPMTRTEWNKFIKTGIESEKNKVKLARNLGLLGLGGGGIWGTGIKAATRAASALPLEGVTGGAFKALDVAVANWTREDLEKYKAAYQADPSAENKEMVSYLEKQLGFDTGSVFDPTFVADVGGLGYSTQDPRLKPLWNSIGRHIGAKATDNWGLSRLWYQEPKTDDHTNQPTKTD